MLLAEIDIFEQCHYAMQLSGSNSNPFTALDMGCSAAYCLVSAGTEGCICMQQQMTRVLEASIREVLQVHGKHALTFHARVTGC